MLSNEQHWPLVYILARGRMDQGHVLSIYKVAGVDIQNNIVTLLT